MVVVCAERVRGAGGVEGAQQVERARVLEDEVGPQHEANVAHDVDHEGLQPGARGGGAPVPKRDQEVGGRAHEGPADYQHQEVAGEDQQQHREHEEVQVREEARVAAVVLQVGDRVQVDQRGDAADDEHHEDRERVHEDRHLRVDADR